MHFDVHCVEGTGSTNSDLIDAARAGAPIGSVLRAAHQTAGRGRLGRTWEAPPGSSLLASVLLPAESVPFVAVARVALAAIDACADLAGVEAALKWPNDLLVGDQKLAGLLAETDAGGAWVVVGIGCNVAWPGPDQADPVGLGDGVTSLARHVAVAPSPGDLLVGLLDCLDGWMTRAPEAVLAAYRGRCSTLGRLVRVSGTSRTFEGRATGITPSGELEVADGSASQVVRVGDVVHVRAR